MTYFPGWLPWDWETRALILAGAALLLVALFAWTAATLRIALRGDWLAAAILQAGGVLLLGSVLCGRNVVPQFQGAGWIGYHWLGREWFHRAFDLYGLDGFAFVVAALSLVVASVGLMAIGSERAGSAS